MKKILSVVLALAMMLIMAMPAFAAADGTITITNDVASTNVSIKDREYSVYKIFNMSKSADGSAVAYTVTSAFDELEWNGVTGDELIAYLEELDDDSVALYDFGKEVYSYAQDNSIAATKTVKADSETVSFTGLEDGYYLVYGESHSYKDIAEDIEGVGSVEVVAAAMLLNTDAEIQIKADAPTIDKSIVNADHALSGEATAVEIGDTVSFKIEATVPNMTGYDQYEYTIYDCMTSGLTYTDGSLKVQVDGVDYTEHAATIVTDSTEEGHEGHTEMTINFPQILKLAGKEKIVVTYDAVLNENAKTTPVENNKAKLQYSNDPYNEGDGSVGETDWDISDVYDFTIRVDKVDEEGNPLGGAKFALKNSKGEYYCYDTVNNKVVWNETLVANSAQYVVTTDDETGYARFYGLEEGTYYLHEVSAPAGYNELKEDVEVVLNPYYGEASWEATIDVTQSKTNLFWDYDENVKEVVVIGIVEAVEVVNTTGTLLPSTGGMGTVIFYVVGGMLVLGSVVVMVTKRRMNAAR